MNAAAPSPSLDSSRSTTPGSDPTVVATEVVLPGVVEPDGLVVRTRELPAPAAAR